MMIEPRVGTPEREAWQKDKNRRALAMMASDLRPYAAKGKKVLQAASQGIDYSEAKRGLDAWLDQHNGKT